MPRGQGLKLISVEKSGNPQIIDRLVVRGFYFSKYSGQKCCSLKKARVPRCSKKLFTAVSKTVMEREK